MERMRENFMENAGDILFEIEESQRENANDLQAPDVTASTPFLSIFCC